MKPEVAQFPEEIAALVAFVEGRIDADAMAALVHGERMKALLKALQNPNYPATPRRAIIRCRRWANSVS